MCAQFVRDSLPRRKQSVTQLVEQWEEIPAKKERVSDSLFHLSFIKCRYFYFQYENVIQVTKP